MIENNHDLYKYGPGEEDCNIYPLLKALEDGTQGQVLTEPGQIPLPKRGEDKRLPSLTFFKKVLCLFLKGEQQ